MSTEGFNVDVRELVEVVKSGNVDLFLEYYLNLKNLINPSNGLCLLHEAVRSGDVNKVRYLIDEGAFILALDGEGMTPMESAIYKSNMEMIECFLSVIDINYLFPSGHTLLSRAMSKRLNLYTSIIRNTYGTTSSSRATRLAAELQLTEISELIQRGADPFLGEPHAFQLLTRYFRNVYIVRHAESGSLVAQRNEILRQILFPKSDRELVLPDHIDKKEILLMVMNDQHCPHKIWNWIKFNPDETRSLLMDSGEGRMSFAEMIFLDNNYGGSFSITILEKLLSNGLISVSNELSERAKVMARDQMIVNEEGFTPSHLVEAILMSDHFYSRNGLSRNGIWNSDQRMEIFQKLVTLTPFDISKDWIMDWIMRLLRLFDYYFSRGSGKSINVSKTIDNWLIPELEKMGVSQIENQPFKCCNLLNYCCRFPSLKKVVELILKGLGEEDSILNFSCQGSEEREAPCPSCGDYHGSSSRRIECGSPMTNALRGNNYDVIVLLVKKGSDHQPLIDAIQRYRIPLNEFSKLAKSLIPLGKFLPWSELRVDYRFSLSGDILKKLDEMDSNVFGLVQRQDPITFDDLHEIDDLRLVIVNHVPWDIENLIQYITKVTRGENKFDGKHPLAGRSIWTGTGRYGDGFSSRFDELGCLYHSRIPIPEENRQRVSNLRQEYENVEEGEALSSVDSENNMRQRLGLRSANNRLPRTYGELLKSYLEVGGLLSRIDRQDFEEIYQIGSILWARGGPWDKAIREKLNSAEYLTWKNRYQSDLSFEEMPYEMPDGLRRKLHDLKLTQLANLDIWHQRMKNEKSDALAAISEICCSGSDRPQSALSMMIGRVLEADYCVMSFGSSICKGYLKSKTTWDRLAGLEGY